MSFDFPKTPTEDQVFTPPGGPSYVYQGGRWFGTVTSSGGGAASITVSDTSPASPLPGALWYESDTGDTFIWYDDGDSAQWVKVNVLTGSAGGAYQFATAQTYNRIVNGAMQHSQENGNTLVTTVNSYGADQFWMSWGGTTMGLGIQRVQVATPRGSANRLRVTTSALQASLGSSDYAQIITRLEGNRIADFQWGTANAKQVILRFGWKGPAGTYHIGIRNSTGLRSYVTAFTISAGQAGTDTEQTFVIPGDVTGTWLNDTGTGLSIVVTLASGTSTQGVLGWQGGNFFATSAQTNGVAASSTWEWFDVGLYCDPDLTGLPPKWVTPDYANELRACQRYWWKTDARPVTLATAYDAANGLGVDIYHPVAMRITPANAVTFVDAGHTVTAQPALCSAGKTAVAIVRTGSVAVYGSCDITVNARM